ncbi:TPA: hypothetical protein ACOQ0H_003942 [Bacillus cereus]
MKDSIGNVITSYIICLILNDLDKFITAGKRKFNFFSESGISSVLVVMYPQLIKGMLQLMRAMKDFSFRITVMI